MRLAPLSLVLLLAAAPVAAQTPLPSDVDPLSARDGRRLDRMEKVVRELRAIVFQGRDTGRPVVVQPSDADYQLQDVRRRVQDLEQTLSRVNNQLETTAIDLDRTKHEAESLRAENKALAERLTLFEQRAIEPAPAAPGAPSDPGATSEDETAAFTSARQLMRDGDYDGAEAAFAAFIQQYPDGANTPEANYWWGKTLDIRNANAQAAGAFIGAIRGWPKTSWAPDATVELARQLIALGKSSDACSTLDELNRRYPKISAQVKARAANTRARAKCA
jgi:tol-pal system protein YbgF